MAAPWVSLFDGASAAGWVEVTGKAFPAGCWRVEEGALHAVVVEGGFQDIRTVRTFREFEFEFEFKIGAGANSGVKYLIERTDTWAAKSGGGVHARGRGPEYQIIDDAVNPDAQTHASKKTGGLYGKIVPSRFMARGVGEWNQGRIVVRGGRAEHWLNGEKVLEYECAVRESPIVLQNHHSDVWFRGMRVRE